MKMVDVLSVTQAGLNSLISSKYFPVDTEDTNPDRYTLTAQDSALLVDMGEVAKESQAAADLVFRTMIDVIGKIVIESRTYIPELPKLFVDPIEWGGFVEHVRVGLSDVMTDEMWNPLGFINYTDPAKNIDGVAYPSGSDYAKRIAEIEHATYKPKTYAKVFKEAKAIMVAMTTAREQLFTAFRSWDEMNRFLSALYTSVENTLSYKSELYALMTISTGIGRAVALSHEIPMRTMWNTNHPNEKLTTVQAALNSTEFVAYAFSVIADTKDNMKRFSVAFNNGEEPVFTPESDNRLIILSKFANNAKFGVRANTYNEELLGIGKYDKITAWQGIYNGTNSFDFDTVSKISFTENSNQKLFGDSQTGTKDIENVVGFMYDRYALGITLDKKKVTQTYTAANDSFNSFYHAIVNYICNDSYNMAVFTLN